MLILSSCHFACSWDDSFRAGRVQNSISRDHQQGTWRSPAAIRPPAATLVAVSGNVERLAPWVLRLIWLLTGLAGSAALDGAIEGGGAGALVARTVLGLGWIAGVAAMTVPAVRSLTAVRVLVPLAVPAAVAMWIGGADEVDAVLAVGSASVTAVVACSADLGRAFVQASAYGAEDRHLLRPPAAYLAAALLSWVLAAAGLTAGVALLAVERWAVGIPVALAGLAVGVWSVPRWHRLTRRWFVVVPVGVVVHDHLVLAETLMLRRADIGAVRLAPADTDAADLTGPAGGHAIEITTNGPVTAVFAGTPGRPGGRAIHLTGCLVAPSRPGRALAAATHR